MNQELLDEITQICEIEQEILSGKTENFNRKVSELHSKKSQSLIKEGRLFDISRNYRFIHCPEHVHDYIELVYMVTGSTTHIINRKNTIRLDAGELLFLKPNVTHEILPADKGDLAVNFVILPNFFTYPIKALQEDTLLRDFILGSMSGGKSMTDYLHFQTSNIVPVQNLCENMIWSVIRHQKNNQSINQVTMSLLLLHLSNHIDKVSRNDPHHYEQNIVFTAVKYIEENYSRATLEEFATLMNEPDYYISKLIKKYSGFTFKEFLQHKRLSQATYLLTTTTLTVENIITAVGYDNSSYFHRIFKSKYGLTPKAYRLTNS